MKTGIIIAVLLHAAFILFGGLIFNTHKDEKPKIVMLDLTDPMAETKPVETKPAEEQDPEEQIEAADEPPPDAAEIIRSLSPVSAAPALEQMSLDAISSVLRGGGGGDDGFGGAGGGSLESGGQVGGKGGPRSLLQESTEASFSMSEIDQKPRALNQVSPAFPGELRGKNMDGTVVVVFIVTAEGKVTGQRVESASHPAFATAALEAVKQWTFEPGTRGGQKVATRMRAHTFPTELR